MTPNVRNGIRPAQEKGPTKAGGGATLAMPTARPARRAAA